MLNLRVKSVSSAATFSSSATRLRSDSGSPKRSLSAASQSIGGSAAGFTFLGPPPDHRSRALLQRLEVLERNELWIGIEGGPQGMPVEAHFGQHDLSVRLAGALLGELFENAAQEVGDGQERVSVVGGFL